ncbi:MAG: N-acetylmuramoyl-L-alanine amidase [Christensenellales bacterium]
MFRVFKLKTILIGVGMVVVSVLLSVGIVAITNDNVPKTTYTIVIDAGHGGRDDGCSGVNGTKESEINLAIAKMLKNDLETLGIKVVLTRCDGNGLYKSDATNYKQSDMEARMKIINNASPDMVISIHQNSYSDSSQCGAQVFYQEDDEVSKDFATSVQSQLISQLDNARQEANKGDYYLLKESKLPAIIVECGYLSNAEEEALLNITDYQNRVAYAIMCGVVKYFNLCG